jgi:hypothetical protein
MYLILKYRELTVNARRSIIVYFLKKMRIDREPSNLSEKDLDRLAQVSLNGR